MSNINHPTIKRQRREERESRPQAERRPASNISLDSITAVLGDPKGKLNRRNRRYLLAARANILVMPNTPAKLPAVRLALKLESLTLVQLGRRRSQFARRAAGAKYQLAALSPDSRFRPPIQAVQDANLFALQQTTAEIEARRLHALGQLEPGN